MADESDSTLDDDKVPVKVRVAFDSTSCLKIRYNKLSASIPTK